MPQIVNRISAIRLALAVSTSLAAPEAYAQAAPAAQSAASATNSEEIVVTGFRKSLEAALNLKKNSVSAVDAIVAEDIAKFPDQNLAESLQRITGVAITRDGGEGKQITVRGLGSQFTVTRVNGMPAQAASMNAGSGGSVNRDRSFDFNVFASELFKSLIVHKTAEANLDEGSLGAVVDLNTGHPLGGKYGLTGLLSVAGAYNDLSKNVGPRLTGLMNWKNSEGTLGINASVAYSKSNTLELGNNTTRWVQTAFKSVTVGGVTSTCLPNSTTYTASTACDQATLAFHARIPRYGITTHDRERLGLTASVEWQPDDKTHFEIDGLYSKYREQREEKWAEILLRSNEKNISLVDPVYDSAGNLVKGTLNNAYNRDEHYLQIQKSSFYQLSATLSHDFTDRLKGTILAGGSQSILSVPIATTIMLDNKTAQGYTFDYTNMLSPVLSFGTSVTDPANFQLAEVRDAPTRTNNTFKTVRGDAEWKATDSLTLKAGASVRRFGFDTQGANRNTLVCPKTGQLDVVLGTLNCTATNYGFPVTSAMIDTVNLGNAGQPAGTTSSFIIANLPATTAFTNLYSRALVPDASNTRSVKEEDKGGYIQADWRTKMLGLDVAMNAGVRYANTSQDSTGLQLVGTALNQVSVHRSYSDWLPSANLNLFPTKDLILRFAVSKAMTRPSLGNLTPGGSVDAFNYKVSYGNPYLDPYRATNFDAGLEWYFARQSLLSVAFFHKSVSSFPVVSQTSGTFASTGLPTSIFSAGSPASINPEGQTWTITKNINGSGAKFDGLEMGIQSPLRFLPGTFKNLGVILNATFVHSTATYATQGPGTTIVATGSSAGTVPLTAVSVTGPFFGMSKVTWNATLYYERGPFSLRGSYSYRGPYNDQNSTTGNIFEGYNAYKSFDAAMRYSINKMIEVSVDATNLLDSNVDRWDDQTAHRNFERMHFGRNVVFGARLKL